jgi:2-C-methyl-D-erythritol 4-phosphate cytidylyltransferase
VLAAAELGAEIVAVHDAARPLVDARDITGVVWALGDADAAILVAPVTDTVKRIGADGTVAETVDRRELRLAQTPQVFRIASLVRAWELAGLDGAWPDESSFLEQAGLRVRSVVAQHPNPKLTTESDLRLIRGLREAY